MCFSLSLFFREAGHSACARSVPFSPVLSTLATFPQDSAAPNVWVSDSFKVKEHCNIFSPFSTERVHPHGCAGSSGCLVFMATSLIKGASGGHEGRGGEGVFSFLRPRQDFFSLGLPVSVTWCTRRPGAMPSCGRTLLKTLPSIGHLMSWNRF